MFDLEMEISLSVGIETMPSTVLFFLATRPRLLSHSTTKWPSLNVHPAKSVLRVDMLLLVKGNQREAVSERRGGKPHHGMSAGLSLSKNAIAFLIESLSESSSVQCTCRSSFFTYGASVRQLAPSKNAVCQK